MTTTPDAADIKFSGVAGGDPVVVSARLFARLLDHVFLPGADKQRFTVVRKWLDYEGCRRAGLMDGFVVEPLKGTLFVSALSWCRSVLGREITLTMWDDPPRPHAGGRHYQIEGDGWSATFVWLPASLNEQNAIQTLGYFGIARGGFVTGAQAMARDLTLFWTAAPYLDGVPR